MERAGNAPACANSFGDAKDIVTSTNHSTRALPAALLFVECVTVNRLKIVTLREITQKNDFRQALGRFL
jgi:hypothetical protein